MLNPLFDLARPLLLAFEPETAHEMTLKSLEKGLHPRPAAPDDPRISVSVFGHRVPNPIGIAAGFDKDARVPDALMALGCGFAECGTITPLAQGGNPQPRVFRLVTDRALINRLGFNNGGHDAAFERLSRRPRSGLVGVNIGANKDTTDRAQDYVVGVQRFYDLAGYLTVNISSPNTPGLRDLQAPAALDALLARVMAARKERAAATGRTVPVVVKISPDNAEADLPAIVEKLVAHRVEGIAVSNTTLARTGIGDERSGKEAGGLSGKPLFHRSTVVLARVHQLTQGRIPLIGIGGIVSGETALAKIEAGATLLQIYTGLVYEGPSLIVRIKQHLAEAVGKAGVASIADLVGTRATEWAAKPMEP